MKKIKLIMVISLAALLSQGCKKDLDTTYQNNPDFTKVYSSGGDVEAQVAGLFNAYYTNGHAYAGIQMMLATASDNNTCSYGNSGMRDMSYEPRDNGWNNSTSYTNQANNYNYFNYMYGVINTASLTLKAINSGTQIGTNGANTARAKAVAKFAQAISYSQLALIYDKAFITSENTSIGTTSIKTASPFTTIADTAISFFDAAISIASASSFTIPKAWLGTAVDMSSIDFVKLCNTYAAKTLAYLPRNKTQLAAVNWTKVKAYATAGITSDFTVVSDDNIWYDEAGYYQRASGWAGTDMYVINSMDPTQPKTWPDNISTLPASQTANIVDKRLVSDYGYVASCGLPAARGYYHFFNYRFARYDALYGTQWIGPKPEVMKAENDLLLAEANAYLGTLGAATTIINAGTRVTRGQMTPVASDLTSIVNAISHERFVELTLTGMGLPYFEMRKLNLLQKGTPLNLPLPGKTISLFPDGINYTFGYLANADGINTSNTGWK